MIQRRKKPADKSQKNKAAGPTFAELSDFYGGKQEIADVYGVLGHERAAVRNAVEQHALGVLQQRAQLRIRRGV